MDSYKKSSVGYTLFLYRQELNHAEKKEKHLQQLQSIKIILTDKLVKKGIRNLKGSSAEDMKAITREMHFKEKLEMELGAGCLYYDPIEQFREKRP